MNKETLEMKLNESRLESHPTLVIVTVGSELITNGEVNIEDAKTVLEDFMIENSDKINERVQFMNVVSVLDSGQDHFEIRKKPGKLILDEEPELVFDRETVTVTSGHDSLVDREFTDLDDLASEIKGLYEDGVIDLDDIQSLEVEKIDYHNSRDPYEAYTEDEEVETVFSLNAAIEEETKRFGGKYVYAPHMLDVLKEELTEGQSMNDFILEQVKPGNAPLANFGSEMEEFNRRVREFKPGEYVGSLTDAELDMLYATTLDTLLAIDKERKSRAVVRFE